MYKCMINDPLPLNWQQFLFRIWHLCMRLSKIWPAKSGICDCWWSARLNLGSLETKVVVNVVVVNTWWVHWIHWVDRFLIVACRWNAENLPEVFQRKSGSAVKARRTLLGKGKNAISGYFNVMFSDSTDAPSTVHNGRFLYWFVCVPTNHNKPIWHNLIGFGAASSFSAMPNLKHNVGWSERCDRAPGT